MLSSPLKVTTPAPRDRWIQISEADPDALVSQTPAWVDAICETGGYVDASRLYETADGKQMVLPLVRTKHLPISLASEFSYPDAWGMGGLISTHPLTVGDVAAVFEDLVSLPTLRISIRPNPLHGEIWSAAAPANVLRVVRRAHVLDLEDSFEVVWNNFEGTARTAIRKAEKSGLRVECDVTGKLIPVFYQLFTQSLDRWAGMQNEPLFLARWRGRRRDPLEKFETLSRVLGEAFRIWVAWVDDQPAASIVVLQGKNVNYTRGAMNKELANRTRANDLLHKMAIEEAVAAGCRYYHMGETGKSSSLAQFKQRFGAVAYNYAEYHLERVPITAIDKDFRTFVKRLLGFQDVPNTN